MEAKQIGRWSLTALILMSPLAYIKAETTSPTPIAPLDASVQTAPLDKLKAAADAGDRDAQFVLALRYMNGADGLSVDPARACRLFINAAEQGHVLGQYNAGVCYIEGIGVNKNPKTAFQWFLKSANQGNLESIYNVALAYHAGDGTKVDLQQAIAWYQKAIEKNNIPSFYGLGLIYTNGAVDIPKDQQKALGLFQKAAEANYPPAQYMLGVYYEKGWGGLEINPKLAFEWYNKSAAQNYKKAFQAIALLYKNQKSWPQYFSWVQKSAFTGMPEAQLELAIAFRDGTGTPADSKESFKWFLEASKQGLPYLKGKGRGSLAR